MPVTTGRATVIDVGCAVRRAERRRAPGSSAPARTSWPTDLAVLNRALARVPARDRRSVSQPGQPPARRSWPGSATARGEQVADGLWTDARELLRPPGRQRRAKVLQPQARLAAVLGGRERPLACEELTLRARLDLDHGRDREAALQLLVALDAALAELPVDPDRAPPCATG